MRMHGYRIILLLCVLLSGVLTAVSAQATKVTVSTVVTPPVSPNISDWTSQSNKVQVILVNTTGQTIQARLAAKITGANGITIASRNDYRPSPLTLNPGVPVVLGVSNLMTLLSPDHLDFVNITKNRIVTGGGLPEGSYTICFEALDYASGNPISAGGTGCTPFSITNLDPPVVITPQSGDTVMSASVQHLQFTWAPPPGAPAGISYRLRIVELMPNSRDANNALASTYSFLEKSASVATCVIGPSDPALVAGKTYAAQVIASDPQHRVLMKNGGKSDPVVFTYGKAAGAVSLQGGVAQSAPAKESVSRAPSSFSLGYAVLPNMTVRGKLSYRFATPGIELNPQKFPLANMPVTLVERIVFHGPQGDVFVDPKASITNYDGQGPKVIPPLYIPGNYAQLATAVTDANGNFTFQFVAQDTFGDFTFNVPAGFGGGVVNLRRVACVMVQSPYYCSPVTKLTPLFSGDNEAGELVAAARSYSLKLTVLPSSTKAAQQVTQDALGGVKVFVLRKVRPECVPANEGQPDPAQACSMFQSEVIAEGVTDEAGPNRGTFTFKRLVTNLGPNDNYLLYARTDSAGTYRYTCSPVTFQFSPDSDSAVFNNEYVYPTATKTLQMEPLPPRISGFIYRGDATATLTPVQNATVTLVEMCNTVPWNVGTQATSAAGGYVYDNLSPQYDLNGNATGHYFKVKGHQAGFRDTTSPGLPALKLGMQVEQSLFLQPGAIVSGTIVDEQGAGVSGTIRIGDGAMVHADAPIRLTYGQQARGALSAPTTISLEPAPFTVKAPITAHQQLIVSPDLSAQFFAETVYVDITKDGQKLAPVVVHRKQHRLKILVNGKTGPPLNLTRPLAKAQVKIGTSDSVLLTGGDGVINRIFASSADNFTIAVAGPGDPEYLPATVNVYAPLSKDETQVTVTLMPAAQVSGKVLLNQRLPVAGARVFIDGWPSQAFTNSNGVFVLHNVPPMPHLTIKASKSSLDTTFVGGQTVVSVPDSGVRGIEITLKVFADMDITRLLGFPVELDTLIETGSAITIKGALVNLPSNSRFSVDSTLRLGFGLITLKPGPLNAGGVPTAKPASLPLVTDANSLALKCGSLPVFLKSKTGLTADFQGVDGAVSGGITVPGANFAVNSANLQGFSLIKSAGGGDRTAIPAISTSGSDLLDGQRLNIADSLGAPLRYKLLDFPAVASVDSSWLSGDTALLATTLHTHITGLAQPDLNLPIGTVRLSPFALGAITGLKPLSIPLEQWTLAADQWSISQAGVMLNKGTLKAGTSSLPFTGIKVTPGELAQGAFALDSLRSSAAPGLAIGGSVFFGYDTTQGHWSLTGWPVGNQPAATLAGLPGCKAGDKLLISNFRMMSNAKREFFLDNNTPPLTLHTVAAFTPQHLSIDSAAVVTGMIDLGMPQVSAQPTSVMFYKKAGGATAFDFQPFTLGWQANGVQANFPGGPQNPQKLDSLGFSARGMVKEDGVFSLAVNLKRTKDSTILTVEPGQQFFISSNHQRLLQNVAGGMQVVNGSWDFFRFDGDLTGADGAASHLALTVKGDIVADNQQVGVKNVDTPFGSLSIIYEPQYGRMSGHLHFEKDLGTAYVMGDADLTFDNDGWYILSGAAFELYNPNYKGTAVSIFGNYPITPQIVDIFKKYSYVYQHKGELPKSFPTVVKGFFFEGMLSIPVQQILDIPNIDIDLAIVSARLWANAGADTRMGMQFSKGKAAITTGMDVFLDVGLKISAYAVVACGGVAMGSVVDQGMEGGFDTEGAWYADATGDFTIWGKAWAGWGICSSDCDGKLCDNDSWSGSKTFGILGHVGSDGKYVKLYSK